MGLFFYMMFPFIRHLNVHSTYVTIWVGTCIKLQTDSENSGKYRNLKSPPQQHKHFTIFQRSNYISIRFTHDSLNYIQVVKNDRILHLRHLNSWQVDWALRQDVVQKFEVSKMITVCCHMGLNTECAQMPAPSPRQHGDPCIPSPH